jgi:hypothetical protein
MIIKRVKKAINYFRSVEIETNPRMLAFNKIDKTGKSSYEAFIGNRFAEFTESKLINSHNYELNEENQQAFTKFIEDWVEKEITKKTNINKLLNPQQEINAK